MAEVVMALKDFQASFERSARAAEACETASRNILKAIDGVAGINPMFGWIKGISGAARQVDHFAKHARAALLQDGAVQFRLQAERAGQFKEQLKILEDQRLAYHEMADTYGKMGNAAVQQNMQTAEALVEAAHRDMLDEQRKVYEEMAKLDFKQVTSAMVATRQVAEYHQIVQDSARDAFDALDDFGIHVKQQQFTVVNMFKEVAASTFSIANNLRQANGSLADRQRYLRDGLVAQIQTGATLATVAQAQKALVELGMEETANFRDQATLVTKLHDGLEVAVNESSQLLNVSDRINVSYGTMANLVAKTARATALNASEATRYATSIARSVQIFSGRETSAAFAGATEQILRLEAAMKSTIGESGAIVELIEAINKGDVRGEIFGLNIGGKFSGDPKEMVAFMDSLSGFASQVKSAGPFAAETAKGLGQALGIQPKLLLSFDEIRKAYEDQQRINEKYADTIEITNALDQAYQENSSEAGEVFAQLKNTVMGLVRYALIPAIEFAKILANGVLSLVKAIRQAAETYPLVMGIVKALGVAVLGGSLIALGSAVVLLARSLRKAVVDIRAAASTLGPATGGGAGKYAFGAAAAGALISGAAEGYGNRDDAGKLTGGAAFAAAAGNIIMFGALLVPVLKALAGPKLVAGLAVLGGWMTAVASFAASAVWGALVIGFKAITAAIVGFVSAIGIVPLAIAAAIAAVGYLVYSFWDEISSAVSGAWNAVTGFLSRTWNSFTGMLSNVWTSIKSGFGDVFGELIEWIKSAPERAWEWAKESVGFGAEPVTPIPRPGTAWGRPAPVSVDQTKLAAMPDKMEQHTRAIVAATGKVEAALASQTEAQREADRKAADRANEDKRTDSGSDRVRRSKDRTV